jgi:hypothetical protein
MKKIFDHYIKTGLRLQNYQRCSTAVKSRQWHPALDRGTYTFKLYNSY